MRRSVRSGQGSGLAPAPWDPWKTKILKLEYESGPVSQIVADYGAVAFQVEALAKEVSYTIFRGDQLSRFGPPCPVELEDVGDPLGFGGARRADQCSVSIQGDRCTNPIFCDSILRGELSGLGPRRPVKVEHVRRPSKGVLYFEHSRCPDDDPVPV